MRWITMMLCALILGPAPASAEEVAPGVEYTGPRQLAYSIAGFSFTLPSGWIGALPHGQTTFLVGRKDLTGNLLIVLEQATADQVKQAMSSPQHAFSPVVLTPKGAVTVKEATVTNDFSVSGAQVPLQARAKAKVDKSGWAVMIVAVAPQAEMPHFVGALDAMLGSAKFAAPKAPSPDNFWARQLANKRLNYFHNASGYSEKIQITLCGNGTFIYGLNATSQSNLGSGVGQSKNSGRWSAAGDGAGGVLNLHYNDGRTAQHRLALSGESLLLDNKRWLRENINCN